MGPRPGSPERAERAHCFAISTACTTQGSLKEPLGDTRNRRPTEVPAGRRPSARMADTLNPCNLWSDRPVTALPHTAVAVGDPL
eukprot:1668230-Pyramimonas_sp.AAC.1